MDTKAPDDAYIGVGVTPLASLAFQSDDKVHWQDGKGASVGPSNMGGDARGRGERGERGEGREGEGK